MLVRFYSNVSNKVVYQHVAGITLAEEGVSPKTQANENNPETVILVAENGERISVGLGHDTADVLILTDDMKPITRVYLDADGVVQIREPWLRGALTGLMI